MGKAIEGRGRKAFLSLLLVGLVGVVAGVGTFSAFSATTQNEGNTFSAGTVAIGDNDAGGVMFNLSNQKPGVTTSKCIKVTYTGSLDSTVKMYTPSTPGAGAQYINLTITPGTQTTSTFPNCDSSTFTPVSGAPTYSGTVQGFDNTHNAFSNGFASNPLNGTKWVTNDALVYKIDMSVQDNNSAQSATSGSLQFTWEAQNQ